MKSDSSTTSNDDDMTKVTSPSQRKRSDSNKLFDSSNESNSSKETTSKRVHKTLRKAATVEDEEPQPERLPLRERRKMRMMSEESTENDATTPTESTISRKFSAEENDDDVKKSPSEVLRSARLQKENQLSSALSNRLQIARQKISRTNEILNTLESDIRNDLTLRETYTLQWEEKQRRMSEEKKLHDKRKLERDQPYLYTNERPVKQLMKKQKHNTSDLMEKLQKMYKEVEEDRVVPTKQRTKEIYINDFVTPPSSRKSVVEIEDPLEMSCYTDDAINDAIFNCLNNIESPKYPSDDEVIQTNIDFSNKQVNEIDFDKVFEYTLIQREKDKQREIDRQEKEKMKQELAIAKQKEEEKKMEEKDQLNSMPSAKANIEDTKLEETDKVASTKKAGAQQDSTVSEKPNKETEFENPPSLEKERKSSVTVSINISSPSRSKKSSNQFDFDEEKSENKIDIKHEKIEQKAEDENEEENRTKEQQSAKTEKHSKQVDPSEKQVPGKTNEVTKTSNAVVSIKIKNITSTSTEPQISSVEVKQKECQDSNMDDFAGDLCTPDISSNDRNLPLETHIEETEKSITTLHSTAQSNEHVETPIASVASEPSTTILLSDAKNIKNTDLAIPTLKSKSNDITELSVVESNPRNIKHDTTSPSSTLSSRNSKELIDSVNLTDLPRPQSSMDLLLEELDEMNRELFEDIENMQKTSRKSSRADIWDINDNMQADTEKKHLFTISNSFDHLNEMNKSFNDDNINERPASVCSDNPFTLSTPTSHSQENLHSKSTPEFIRNSSDSLFTISKILASNENLQTFSHYKEFNSREDIRQNLQHSKFDENNNNTKIKDNVANTEVDMPKRSESISSLSGLSRSSLSDSSEILYLKDSSQIKMSYREKREAHLKLLQAKKRVDNESISENDEFAKEIENERTEVENEKNNDEKSIGNVPESVGNDFSTEKITLPEQIDNQTDSQHIEKSASFDNAALEVSKHQNKARTYYRKTKSTFDAKRSDFKNQKIHSKSVEHY